MSDGDTYNDPFVPSGRGLCGDTDPGAPDGRGFGAGIDSHTFATGPVRQDGDTATTRASGLGGDGGSSGVSGGGSDGGEGGGDWDGGTP